MSLFISQVSGFTCRATNHEETSALSHCITKLEDSRHPQFVSRHAQWSDTLALSKYQKPCFSRLPNADYQLECPASSAIVFDTTCWGRNRESTKEKLQYKLEPKLIQKLKLVGVRPTHILVALLAYLVSITSFNKSMWDSGHISKLLSSNATPPSRLFSTTPPGVKLFSYMCRRSHIDHFVRTTKPGLTPLKWRSTI